MPMSPANSEQRRTSVDKRRKREERGEPEREGLTVLGLRLGNDTMTFEPGIEGW